MATLEDCIERLDEINWDPPRDNSGQAYGISNSWDRRFISEVAWHTRDSTKPLSTGQVGVILKLVDRYQVHLELAGMYHSHIEQVLIEHTTRLPPNVSSSVKREVRWAGGSNLVFRFKFNPEVKDALKAFKASDCFGTHKTTYEPKNKLWVVPVSVANYAGVIEIISRYGFDFDDDVARLLAGVSNSRLSKSEITLVDNEICVETKDDAFMARMMSLQDSLWGSDV